MPFLLDTEKQAIKEAIAGVEQNTRGELVAVIAQTADDYLYVSMMWAALIALAIPGVSAFFSLELLFAYQYALQIGAFLLLAVLLRWQPILKRIIPRALKHRRAHRLAVEQFLSHNLHHTRERTGVLIFVSVAEQYVEIIADEGIHAKVEQYQWDTIVADFTSSIRAGRIAAGFLNASAACGDLLTTHFPPGPDDINELPDHLIEI